MIYRNTVEVAYGDESEGCNFIEWADVGAPGSACEGTCISDRSQAIQLAIDEKLARMDKSRLARECSKANPTHEKAMAEEGMPWELAEWPEY